MRKLFILIATLLSASVLMAGGDTSPTLSPVVNVQEKLCDNDGVYIDRDANLMWQDAVYTDAEDGAYKRDQSIGKVGTYAHAMNYCSRLNYDGFSDWRLPTSNELMAVHRQHGQVFVNHRGNPFWSSTPTTENRYEVVFPADSYPYMRRPNSENYIRCVRCLDK